MLITLSPSLSASSATLAGGALVSSEKGAKGWIKGLKEVGAECQGAIMKKRKKARETNETTPTTC